MWAGMARDVEVIWVKREPEYFCKRGWTTQISLIAQQNFFSARTRPDTGDQARMDIVGMHVELEAIDLLILLVIKRDPDDARRLGIDGEIDALGGDRGAELFCAPGAGNEFGTGHLALLK